MDKAFLKKIKHEIDEALVGVGKRNNISLTSRSISYGDTNFTVKLEGALIDNGRVLDRGVTDWNLLAGTYGFANEDLGKTFAHNGEVFVIAGLKPASTKYPIIARLEGTQKAYKFPANLVRFCLTKENK